ncbi:hypothetical protein JTB14_037132 [Gonioctena quinquepunctata]|nr:hypothetical protein JTB14_037132 [Gonioctena quinquepunctata]
MSKVLFTAEEDETLVEWVGKYPCLYDLLSTYKDQRIKDSAWKEIAEVLKKPGTNSNLFFRSKSNIVEQDCANTPADDTDDSDIEPTEQSIVSCESNSAAASSSNRESNSDAASSSNRESNSSSSNFRLEEKPINKRKKCQISDMMEERQKERNKVLQMITNDGNDDVSLFFLRLAASVKKLPSELINEAKMKTLQLVFELGSRAKKDFKKLREIAGKLKSVLYSKFLSPLDTVI